MAKGMKDKLPLVAAVICGLVAVFAVNKYIKEKTTIREAEKVTVLTAAKDIPVGSEIGADHITAKGTLSTCQILKRHASRLHILVPSGKSPAATQEAERIRLTITGRKANRAIPKGEAILWSDFVEEEGQKKLSDKLAPPEAPCGEERRAVAVPVDEVSAVGYHIVPGDHVDVLVTLEPKVLRYSNIGMLQQMAGGDIPNFMLEGEGPKTTLLMQDVVVLATGQSLAQGADARGYSTITLDVLPKEAALLVHARRIGSLMFVLRSPKSQHRLENPADAEVTDDTIRARIGDLDEERRDIITIIHGETIDTYVVPKEGK